MPHFQKSMIPKHDQQLSRGPESEQVKKICYGCNQGFCKRKGREKAACVENNPGLFLCKKCVNVLMEGRKNDKIRMFILQKSQKEAIKK